MSPRINGLEWSAFNLAKEATGQEVTFAGKSARMIRRETIVFYVLQDLFAHSSLWAW